VSRRDAWDGESIRTDLICRIYCRRRPDFEAANTIEDWLKAASPDVVFETTSSILKVANSD
jgi:hypothetical protein